MRDPSRDRDGVMTTHFVYITYIILWIAATTQRDLIGKVEDKDQKLALRYSSLILSFFALEAYLNHLGQRIRPQIWQNERAYFSGRKAINGRKYRGVLGKLEYLAQECSCPFDGSERPMSTIKILKEFRDLVAHGKTEDKTIDESCRIGERPPIRKGRITKHVEAEFVDRALQDVENLIQGLHQGALKAFPESELEECAFGMHFWQLTQIE